MGVWYNGRESQGRLTGRIVDLELQMKVWAFPPELKIQEGGRGIFE